MVSGGARGVDQVAHQIALMTGVKTLVWLPSGLGHIYPGHFTKMAQEILSSGGVLLSEFDYQETMRKHHFVERNRLIAGMSQSLFIPQAALRSGTIMTAHFSLELGRPIFVIPGHPLITAYGGNLELGQLGATFVRSSRDLEQFLTVEIEAHHLPANYS